MKTSLYFTLSSLAALTATAMFLSTACPALGAASGSPNNPDKVCKYKKKCPSCDGTGSCDDSDPDKDTKTKTVGHNEECPDPVTAGFGEDYELVGGGGTRSTKSTTSPVVIRSGFSSDFINPKNLNVYGQGAEVVRDGNTNIRQIKTDTGFLDVVFTPEAKTVELRQYKPEDVGTNKVNGVYPIKDDRIPLVVLRYVQEADDTIRVDTIDNASEFPSVKSERTKQTVGPKPYTITQQKTYLKGEGISSVEYRRVSKTITGIPGGQPKEEQYFYTTEDMGTDGAWHVMERKTGRRAEYKKEDGLVKLYECNAVNENGTPVTPIATEESYTYYTDPMKPESFGKIKTLRRNDGYWENKYYDENANAGIEVEKTESPWLNTTAHEPGTAPAGKIRTRTEVRCSTDSGMESLTETVDGIAIAKEWTEKTAVNQQMVREVRHQPHSGGDKVTATVRYRRAKDVPDHLTGKTVSVHHADGSMELYSYALNGQDLMITQDTGYGEGDSVSHGTRVVSTQNKDSGELKEEIRYALEGGQAYWLGSKTGASFDNKGVALKWVYNNNPDDYTEQRKDCCHVTWERGRDGITTTYTYDSAGRQTSLTTRGIKNIKEYNGLTTVHWKQSVGSSQKYLDNQETLNLAKQTVEEKNPVVGGKSITTLFRFDIPARTETTITPQGTTVNRIVTADGKTLSEAQTTGVIMNYVYTPTSQNGGGMIVEVMDGSRSRTVIMDLLGNAISEQFTPNALTQHMYDANGRITKSTLPDGEIQLYAYENGTQISGLDLNGDGIMDPIHDRMIKNELTFDPNWPAGKGSWKTTTENASQGNWKPVLFRWTTEDGTLTRSQVPGLTGYTLLEKSSIKESGSNHTDITTESTGQIQEITYTVDNGQITAITTTRKDATGQIMSTVNNTLNPWGNVLTQTEPRAGTTTYIYDEGTGTLLSQTTPNQATTSYQYDDFGRLAITVLPDGSEQHIAYNPQNRITRQWGALQHPVSYEYDTYGQMTSMTTYRIPIDKISVWPEGDKGDKTTWMYDSATGNLLQKTYADGKGMAYTYTPGGKLLTQTNARGNTITNSYNLAGQLVKIHVNDNGITPTKTHLYDQIGRIISSTTEGEASYRYHYNDWNQVIEEQITIPTSNGTLERNLVRSYDAYGRATGYRLQQGDTVEQDIAYTYTPAGQLAGVTADGKEFTYAYVPNAPKFVAQVTSPVHTVTNSYAVNQDILVSKVNRWKNKVDSSIISAYTYVTNSLGQRVSVSTEGEVFGSNPANWAWGYDALGQVVRANEDRYAYDQIGNRRTCQKANSPETIYSTNVLNQYSQIGNIHPTYDADGNQLAGLMPTLSLSKRNLLVFTYNAENRPMNVSLNGEIQETYSYDHMGRRVKKGDTVTLYDGYNAIAEYKESTQNLKTTYAWGIDFSVTWQGAGGIGGLLSVTEHARQLPLISYPCYDGSGNITEYLTEENSGTVTAHYEYDSFGQIIRKTGDKEYKYQFSTKYYDILSGLVYYNYRSYDPVSGRWIGRDPITEKGGFNLYAFVYNMPTILVDVHGEFALALPFLAPLGIGAVVAAAVPVLAAVAVGVVVAVAVVAVVEIIDTDQPEVDEKKKKKNKGMYVCTAKGGMIDLGGGKSCCGWLIGTGIDKSKPIAEKLSRKDANNKTPRGCQAKHLNVTCVKN